MFPRYRHAPIFDPDRKRCPVCNQGVYSLAGIHPQCAIKLAEGPQVRGKKQAAFKSDSPVALVAPGKDTEMKATGESTSHAAGIFPFEPCRSGTPPQIDR
jgi:hypothetical protein